MRLMPTAVLCLRREWQAMRIPARLSTSELLQAVCAVCVVSCRVKDGRSSRGGVRGRYVDELETKLKHYERLLESAQVTARHAAPAATASYVAQGPAPPGGSPGEDDGAAPPMDRQLPHKSPGAPGSGAEGLPATTDAPIGAQFTNNSSTPTRETAAVRRGRVEPCCPLPSLPLTKSPANGARAAGLRGQALGGAGCPGSGK